MHHTTDMQKRQDSDTGNIWRSDANGQLGSKDKTEEEKYVKKGLNIRSIIGPYTRAQRAESGNGANIRRICRRQQMIPMTTWKNPMLLRQDKWQQQSSTTTKENWEQENREKYLTTWTSPDGNICMQNDYITINAKHGNMARKAQSNIYWRGNMHQNQQQRAQTMQPYYSAAKK